MTAEGGLKNFYRLLAGNKIINEYKLMCRMSSLPSWLRGMVGWILEKVGESRLGWLARISG